MVVVLIVISLVFPAMGCSLKLFEAILKRTDLFYLPDKRFRCLFVKTSLADELNHLFLCVTAFLSNSFPDRLFLYGHGHLLRLRFVLGSNLRCY